MEFKKIELDQHCFYLNVEDEKWIRIRHDDHLVRALKEIGNLPIAKRAKDEYKKVHGKDIRITTESVAMEISGHVIPGELSYKVQEGNNLELIHKGMEEIQKHTDIIDIGEKDVDGNRMIWDAIQILPFAQDKREETT